MPLSVTAHPGASPHAPFRRNQPAHARDGADAPRAAATEVVRERCEILVRDAKQQRAARDVLTRSDVPLNNVRFHVCPTDRVWTRDSGPIFVKRGRESVATHWRFNAWAKYPDWKKDQHVPEFIAWKLDAPQFGASMTTSVYCGYGRRD